MLLNSDNYNLRAGDFKDNRIRPISEKPPILHNFSCTEEADLAMITAKNEGMAEAVKMIKNMSIRKSLRLIYDDYWKAKRDRWAEDDYIRDEGIAVGRTEGIADSILTLLGNIGDVPADLREKIVSQKDKAVLEQWLLAASGIQDIRVFRERTGL